MVTATFVYPIKLRLPIVIVLKMFLVEPKKPYLLRITDIITMHIKLVKVTYEEP